MSDVNWSLLYLISEWVTRFIMLVYVPQRRTAASARTWLLLIFLLPMPGVILYALFGRIYLPRRRIEMQERASRTIRKAQELFGTKVATTDTLPDHLAPIVILARQLGDFEAVAGNALELLPVYGTVIDRIIDDINSAKRHVRLLFYIFQDDVTGRNVADALVAAVERGVSCTLLIDAVGSKRVMKGLAHILRAKGVEVHATLPVGVFRSRAARFDLRNHRKIAIIDGRIAYAGSQNITDPEFVPGYPNEELMVRMTGPVVRHLQAVYFADYYFETGREPNRDEISREIVDTGSSLVQVVPSGPGYRRQNGQELIVAMIYGARERVVITTPYFVPDEPFLQALRSATLRGVAVHLVVSKHANQLVTQFAQRAFYDNLLEAGVVIHLYEPRFLHAKHLTIDGCIALIGSTNMDIRSFALNEEINLLVYDQEIVARVQALQETYFAESECITSEEWSRRTLSERVLQNIARLTDSLL
jgi:cardiolipin synthase A/B